jgi:hypothetical protein
MPAQETPEWSDAVSRYQALCDHLRAARGDVPMGFAEIEAVVGAPLPASARRHRGWWSNNPTNSGATRAWLAAGYRTAEVDMAGERLVFRRERAGAMRLSPTVAHSVESAAPSALEDDAMPEPALALQEAASPFAQGQSMAARPVAAPPTGAPHALFGRMRGALRVLAGVDVTVPADPGWADDAGWAGRPG